MAIKVGELYGLINLEDKQFHTALAKAKRGMSRAASDMGGSAAKLASSIKGRLIGMAKTVALSIGAAAIAGGAAALKLAGDWEQSELAFETMLGSAEKAKAFMEELEAFASRTPFELPGLIDASRKLLAFGFAAEDIVPMMTAIGNAVSGLGGGAQEIDQVTRALGQMRAKGKVSAEEMMQLAELGIPAWEMLAKTLNTSVGEAMARVTRGQVDAATGIKAVIDGMNEKFPGMMEKQSKTLLGRLSTLKDTAAGILRQIGQHLEKTFDVKGKLERFSKWLKENESQIIDWATRIAEAVKVAARGLADFVLGMTGQDGVEGASISVRQHIDNMITALNDLAQAWVDNANDMGIWVNEVGRSIAKGFIYIERFIAGIRKWTYGGIRAAQGATDEEIKQEVADWQKIIDDSNAKLKALDNPRKATRTARTPTAAPAEIADETGEPKPTLGSAIDTVIGDIEAEEKARQEAAEKAAKVYEDELQARERTLVLQAEAAGDSYRAQAQEALNAYNQERRSLADLAKEGIDVRSRMAEASAKFDGRMAELQAERRTEEARAQEVETQALESLAVVRLRQAKQAYQAERAEAENTFTQRMRELDLIAVKEGEQAVAYQRMLAEKNLSGAMGDINAREEADMKARAEKRRGLLADLQLSMVKLSQGSLAAELLAIDQEAAARRAMYAEAITDARELASVMQALDAETAYKRQSVMDKQREEERRNHEQWLSEQRSKVGFMDIAELGRNLMLAGARQRWAEPTMRGPSAGGYDRQMVDRLTAVEQGIRALLGVNSDTKRVLERAMQESY